MTQEEEYERFIHFKACIQTINCAWRILQEIKNREGGSCSPILVGAAFQFALIEYAKPFLKSRGEEVRNHQLDERFTPPQHLELHKRIVNARNQIHSHSDLTVMDAKLYVNDSPSGRIVLASQNIIHGTEELPNLDVIIELIEQTLNNMDVEETRLEQLLSLTP